ncbi:hypothetical protein [Roseobacter sp. HKCCA0434]|uniref:hypothetical protein n=1 Tax=Roseobacter sp. HKCCA0434 TaxID=3079297 RepID=UPI002905BDDE|nr:hypothetical protein [Roseobacter sp. HKCCA0434]
MADRDPAAPAPSGGYSLVICYSDEMQGEVSESGEPAALRRIGRIHHAGAPLGTKPRITLLDPSGRAIDAMTRPVAVWNSEVAVDAAVSSPRIDIPDP